jgi:type III pantothenate kinase
MKELPSGMRLVVLLGNTTCRMALMEGIDVRESLILSHAELSDPVSIARVLELCKDAAIVETGLCSVVPRMESTVYALLLAAGMMPPLRVQPAVSSFFPSRYRLMDTLGADRYCGVLAARERFGAPVIVVDCGTATTVNVVDDGGVFLGGAIAPGLETMLSAMHDRTAQLPSLGVSAEQLSTVKSELPPFIGGDTNGSMLAGSVHFTRYAVEGLVRATRNHIGHNTPVILTGGNALILLGAGLSCDPLVHDEYLLFRGIIFYLLFTR